MAAQVFGLVTFVGLLMAPLLVIRRLERRNREPKRYDWTMPDVGSV